MGKRDKKMTKRSVMEKISGIKYSLDERLSSDKSEKIMRVWFSSLVYLSAVIGIIAIFGASYIFGGNIQYPMWRFPSDRLVITGFDVLGGPPNITNPEPDNNTYVPGGDATFNVSVVDNDLDNSSVNLYIKSEDAQTWDNYQMECASLNESTWECEVFGVTLSLDIVGSDTVELFYFTAGDYSGNTGYLGNSTHPMRFTVDVNPPEVEFLQPKNGSHVSGNSSEIKFEVFDSSSGTDSNSVEYSLDNQTWYGTDISEEIYEGQWDTTLYSDNESMKIYVIASDKINNTIINTVNITVDNTLPLVEILDISTNQTVKGVIMLKSNVSDDHSGVEPSAVRYSVADVTRSMDCEKQGGVYFCNEYFDSRLVSDGINTVEFSVYDIAGNRNSSFVDIEVDNKVISASITSPVNNDYVRDEVEISGRVTNAEGKVTGVTIGITGDGYELDDGMSCDSEWECIFQWSTLDLEDGEYSIFVNATNIGDTFVNDSLSVILDNTYPELLIDSPLQSTVNGTITVRLIISDNYGVLPGTVYYNISDYKKSMNCVQYIGGRRYVCGSVFNTTQLLNGQYDIIFYGSDYAGNSNTSSKRITVYNSESDSGNGVPGGTTTTTIDSNFTTTVITTTVESGGITWIENITRPIVENPIIGPIVLTFSGSGSPIGNTFSSWPIKALAVSMVIFLIVVAMFRNTQIVRFFTKGRFKKEEDEMDFLEEEDEVVDENEED